MFSFIKSYFFPKKKKQIYIWSEREVKKYALFLTGPDLINRIYEAIISRHSVLVTGPRGCGKSYCVEQAIRLAQKNGKIGGWKFLQGNREIPRDYLSEDIPIIDKDGKFHLKKALAIQENPGINVHSYISNNPVLKEISILKEIWPGVPSYLTIDKEKDPRQFWRDKDYTVLYLDEITRFNDGFLDSLLSLLEEKKVIRRGEEIYVPIVVIATANPPGYDITCKKLSPPLQARITRSYRVSQPPLSTLTQIIIIPKILKHFEKEKDFIKKFFSIDENVKCIWYAASITLALWGDPKSNIKGLSYLTDDTIDLLKKIRVFNKDIYIAMKTLSTLILFGPDARASFDWLITSIVRCQKKKSLDLKRELADTVLEVLPHKVRANFNEGAEPGKLSLLEYCISIIANNILNSPNNVILLDDYYIAKEFLEFPISEEIIKIYKINERLMNFPLERRKKLKEALKSFRNEEKWKNICIRLKILDKKGSFIYREEEEFFKYIEELFTIEF